MGFTEPDSPPPPQGVPQMPQASTPGPAPVPYGGNPIGLAPSMLAAMPDVSPDAMPGDDVMSGVPGASPLAAPNPNPYEAGVISPVDCGQPHMGAATCDIVSATVAGAVAAAQARAGSRQRETYNLGSQIGDLMQFGPSPLDPGEGLGLTLPEGHYYDPPRAYEGNQ